VTISPITITDWRDGPVEGVASLSAGSALWIFRLFAEDPHGDTPNNRLFLLSRLREETMGRRVLESVAASHLPVVWPFDDQPNPAAILSAVEAALESAIPATLAVNLVDFNTVTKAWKIA
jgi:hypothetical protein